MDKTILELCQELPDSESGLRARALEFNEAVAINVLGYERKLMRGPIERPTEIGAPDEDKSFGILVYRRKPGGQFSFFERVPEILVADDDFALTEPIVWAKKATDAMRQKSWGLSVQVECDMDFATCKMWTLEKGEVIEVIAEASTEELARAACALLAADAVKVKN